VETRWTNASVAAQEDEGALDGQLQLLSDTRSIEVAAPALEVYRTFSSIGGTNGWYYGNVLWAIRGFVDKMVGGVGLRRGRRHPTELRAGDTLDFWRVESVVPGERILLRAEMKVPGRAWLEFSVRAKDETHSLFTQTAKFYPRGLWGLAYWYGVYPLHLAVFKGMANAVARRVVKSTVHDGTGKT
jgi:hypothetical protein